MPCSRGLSSNTVALGFSTISPMHIDMKMCCTVVLADSFCWCFFLYLRVCVFLCFVPAYTCFSTGSFDALVFVLLKVPELKKLVVAKVWLEIALRVLKGSSFVEAYNPNSPRVSRLFEEQHDRKVAAAFNRHLKPLSSAHRSRQAAPLSAHKLLGKLSDAPLLVHLAKSLARKLMPKSSKALFQVDWEDWEKAQGNAYSCSIMFHPLWSSD